MRRSASEIIRNLEMRVARLEKQSSRKVNLKGLSKIIAKEFSSINKTEVVYNEWWIDKVESNLERYFTMKEGVSVNNLKFEVSRIYGYDQGSQKVVNLTVDVHSTDGVEEVEYRAFLAFNGRFQFKRFNKYE